MEIKDLLQDRREVILKKWSHVLLQSYPEETSRFFRKEKDPFANPVGSAFMEGISGIYRSVLNGVDRDEVSPFLDRIIRIRAVQDFTPSEAIGFLFLLKKVIREELFNEISQKGLKEELYVIESRIDDLALIAFDIYMQCREKIYDLKASELRNMTYKLLERANLLKDFNDEANGDGSG
ncbi:MAG: hypothetical protein GXO97_07990 [Nitrospirae bacterium]|nr:hypothetical protein [Nitrospirota bacterium]